MSKGYGKEAEAQLKQTTIPYTWGSLSMHRFRRFSVCFPEYSYPHRNALLQKTKSIIPRKSIKMRQTKTIAFPSHSPFLPIRQCRIRGFPVKKEGQQPKSETALCRIGAFSDPYSCSFSFRLLLM